MLMIEKQVQNIDDTIRSLKARIEAVNSNKNEIQKAKQSIYQKLQQANGDSDELVQMREKLASGNPDSADLLMYVNKVQQQTNYLNNLQQSIVSFDREIESLTDEESRLLEEIEALNVKKFELLSQKNTQLPLQAADLKSNIVVLKVKLDQGEKENIKKRKKIVTTGEKELMLKSEYTKKEIDTLKAKMKDIRAIEVLQLPFSSKNPVKPAKAKIIVLSFFLGGLLAVFFAFIREFWINNKSKIIHAK
jgi:chromosome segregation ATPase